MLDTFKSYPVVSDPYWWPYSAPSWKFGQLVSDHLYKEKNGRHEHSGTTTSTPSVFKLMSFTRKNCHSVQQVIFKRSKFFLLDTSVNHYLAKHLMVNFFESFFEINENQAYKVTKIQPVAPVIRIFKQISYSRMEIQISRLII